MSNDSEGYKGVILQARVGAVVSAMCRNLIKENVMSVTERGVSGAACVVAEGAASGGNLRIADGSGYVAMGSAVAVASGKDEALLAVYSKETRYSKYGA